MKRLVATFIAFAIVSFAVTVFAQQKPVPPPVNAVVAAPVLSEVDGLKVKVAFLEIDKAQSNLDKMKAEFQTLLQGLQKPGYVIGQGPDGKLAYIPEPKPEPPPAPVVKKDK